jgi:hypothetical protein
MHTVQSFRDAAQRDIHALSTAHPRGFGGPDLLCAMQMGGLAMAYRVAAASDTDLDRVARETNEFDAASKNPHRGTDTSDVCYAARCLPLRSDAA